MAQFSTLRRKFRSQREPPDLSPPTVRCQTNRTALRPVPARAAEKLWERPWWEPPASAGELDFSPAEERRDFEMGFSPGFLIPGAKARDQHRALTGALKRSFPRMNAGAPTKKYIPRIMLCQ